MAVGLAGALTVAMGALWWSSAEVRPSPEELLVEARSEQRRNHLARAEELAARAAELDPQRAEAVLLAGDCAAAQQAWSRALDHYRRVVSADADVQLSLRLRQAAILHDRQPRLADAERAYRAALEIAPDHVQANTGLAKLLSLCGRKDEVTPHVLRVIRQGQEHDLLLLFVRGTVAIGDVDLLNRAREADPSDPNPPLGLAWHAVREERTQEAWPLLQTVLQLQPENTSAHLLKGQLLLRENRTGEFPAWGHELPTAADAVGEVWLLRGQMADVLGENPAAIRCYWEALRRMPESKVATFRLVHLSSSSDNPQLAERFRERLQRLLDLESMQNQVLFATDHGRPELLLPLAKSYEAAGRLWEAYGWGQFALEVGVEDAVVRDYVMGLRRRLQGEPLQLVTDAANPALAVDLSHYPLPRFISETPSAVRESAESIGSPTFRDDAVATGLQFRYFNGVEGPTTHRMFEFTGGGIGVLDFDLDGFADVFFTQGCRWPPGTPDDSGGDRLFRNRGGVSFEDVTFRAEIHEHGFGQGIAVGDFNSDGFPDLYVANIGANALWLNLGDGTFRDVTQAASLSGEEWTTSTVMADLTGDGLPDIYDVNYVTAPDIFQRVCSGPDGLPALCMPFDFQGQPDRFWLNLGDGQFREATVEVLGETPPGMGLGVAAWDAEGNGRLSLYVANDTTPSFYFRPESNSGDKVRLRESGIEAGLALNAAGKATACMGVALGDVDNDGRLDLHITNFYAEANTLFLNSSPGFFEDQTRRVGLEAPSFNKLGFGTQFLDADLDGRLELFVANGHVDDLSRLNKPYRMPPQLYRWDGSGKFAELPASRLGSYFEQQWLGRSAVRLDWNRDGREDLLVGHLGDVYALLTNVTSEHGGHMSLRLFGVQSNRDAIGTTVEARVGSRTFIRQLTAGDGYQAGNERRLVFGLGRARQVDEMTIRWPSGTVQRLIDLPASTELWLREEAKPLSVP